MTWKRINLELWPKAEFYSTFNLSFHVNGQLNISQVTNLAWMWSCVCVGVCVWKAGTNKFPPEQYVLFNKLSDHNAVDINSHKRQWNKTARLSQSYIKHDWHHKDVRQRTNLQWLCLQCRYGISSTSSSRLPAWIRVKQITVKSLVWMGHIRSKWKHYLGAGHLD